ncbi:hypothetical protein OG612_18620 [Streptomyces sp. NBC_01527]|uniref:hypothetical protein n=1 Tax=Streptomyces sp. NBC_01527 TaxID=2903894 RepID=UPI00386BD04F
MSVYLKISAVDNHTGIEGLVLTDGGDVITSAELAPALKDFITAVAQITGKPAGQVRTFTREDDWEKFGYFNSASNPDEWSAAPVAE